MLGVLSAFVIVPMGMVGWILMPRKLDIARHQITFLKIVTRDIFHGIPKE